MLKHESLEIILLTNVERTAKHAIGQHLRYEIRVLGMLASDLD
jgi:hypothetical protein